MADVRTVEKLTEAIHDAGPLEHDGGVPDVCNRWEEHRSLAMALMRAGYGVVPEPETLERRLEACLDDVLQITGAQVRDGRLNADMMLAETKLRAAITHLKLYVAGIAL